MANVARWGQGISRGRNDARWIRISAAGCDDAWVGLVPVTMEPKAKTDDPSCVPLRRPQSGWGWLLFVAACSPEADELIPDASFPGDSSGGTATVIPSGPETFDEPWTSGDGSSESGGATETDGEPSVDCEAPAGPPAVAWAAGWEPYVLKVDASTATVEGIYTGPVSTQSGRGMSVSQGGDAAVTFFEFFSGDRTVAVIRSEQADCVESNGEAGIQTSSGPDDLLEFSVDDCVAWSTILPDDTRQDAAVAWGRAQWSTDDCRWEGADLWVGRTRNGPQGDESVVSRLDGETGEVEATVVVPDVSRIGDLAVDANDDLWIAGAFHELGRLDAETLEYESFVEQEPEPSGQLALQVDADGRIWRCTARAVERLSPHSGQVLTLPLSFSSVDHCALDLQGQLWVASSGYPSVTLVAYSLDTLEVVQQRSLATDTEGLATDGQGHVWRITGLRMDRWDPFTDELARVALPSAYGLRLDTLVTAVAPAFAG